jgi:hypothetical protein
MCSAVETAVETELGQTKLGDANHPWLPHSATGSYGGTTETYQRATGPFHRKGGRREDVTSSDTGIYWVRSRPTSQVALHP